jgi:hypothetical protein
MDAAGLEEKNRGRFSTASGRVLRAEAAAKNRPPAPAGRARCAHAQRRLGRAEWAAKRPKAGRGKGDGCAPGWAAPAERPKARGRRAAGPRRASPQQERRGGREGQTGPRAGESAQDNEEGGGFYLFFSYSRHNPSLECMIPKLSRSNNEKICDPT